MSSVKVWFLAARPKTLTAAIIPILAASALVRSQSYSVKWDMVIFALLSSFFIQIATNLINDAVDFKKGADNADRLGPVRATQSGLISPNAVLNGGYFCLFCATIVAVPLVIEGGWPIVIIGLASLLMAYGYTGGPYPLAYKGLGDLFVIIFFGLVAVSGMVFLMTHQFGIESIVLGLQVGFLNTILIAINNLRDIKSDIKANKKTLATRLGITGSKVWICFLIIAPFIVGYYWLIEGKKWLYILPVLSLPLGLSVFKGILRTEPSEKYNSFLGRSAGYGLIFAICFYIGSYL